MKAPVTYILVADGCRARVLVHAGPGRGVVQLADSDFRQDIPPDRELYRGRPSRVHESVGPSRSAVERPSLHDRAKALFARWLIAFLDKRFASRQFSRLIIVSPPDMLADLRIALSGPMGSAVIAELNKDLPALSNSEVYDHLQKSLSIPL